MAGFTRCHGITVEFMEDLEESECGIFQGKFPCFRKWADGLLNPEAQGRQFGDSDVYDGPAISIDRNRIPGSRVRIDKNNDRKGKGTCRKGQMEVNWEERRKNPGESDNHYSHVVYGESKGFPVIISQWHLNSGGARSPKLTSIANAGIVVGQNLENMEYPFRWGGMARRPPGFSGACTCLRDRIREYRPRANAPVINFI